MVRRPKDLTNDERNRCVQFILQGCTVGKPKRGRLLAAQGKFGISRATVSRLWASNYELIKSLKLSERGSIRAMEPHLPVSRATIQRWAKAGLFNIINSAINPSLTVDNKYLRMRFSLESIELDRVMNKLKFSTMHNIVHIDEKWFYITKAKRRYYLAPDEEEPYRACKSKKFIGKIMFMCAVSRPILRDDGSVLFDGKIGCFPFITQEIAKRNSKYRLKGTPFNKAVDSITREVIKDTIINKVMPAIREKWPEGASKNIIIQQDNAKPHIKDHDPEFRQAATKDGFNISLTQQPPNSPDTNINDLGFFNAIQSLQHQRTCTTVDDLVKAVQDAFHELPPMTLNKVFLTLQGCLIEIMKAKGHNNYKIPHMAKDRLIREGTLPICLEVPIDLARAGIQFLVENGQIRGIEQLIYRLGLQQLTGIEDHFASVSIT